MNVAYNAFLSTIFAAFLAAHSVSTTYILFTDFVLEAADAKKKRKVNFPENGLFTLGKGILYGTTVYIICQVVADRVFTIWGILASDETASEKRDII